MSFGIYLYRQDGAGLVAADAEAVRAVLVRYGWDGTADPCQVATPDGVLAEFYASGLDGGELFCGGNLEVRGFSPGLCQLVLDLARAGPFAVTRDGDPRTVIVTSEAHRADLPGDVDAVLVCVSAGELEAAIDGGFDGWREYRDRVVGGS